MTIKGFATAVETSGNTKTGPISITEVALASCPTSCKVAPICYATTGTLKFHTGQMARNVEASADEVTPEIIAQAEADAISDLTGRRILRLHVTGDSKTDKAAQIVSAAADRHTAKHSKAAFTYTHAWGMVKRSSWGGVKVRASVEDVAGIKTARDMGYPAAIVIDEFPNGSKSFMMGSEKITPCPEQSKADGPDCESCRLCPDTDITIAFAKH